MYNEIVVPGVAVSLLYAELTGASRLARPDGPRVQAFSSAAALPLASPDGETVLFAAGNIASEGRALMERVEREATPYVQ